MLSLDWSLFWTIVNLLILLLLLKKFLFGPITKIMESRQAEIEKSLLEAEEQKQQALAEEKELAAKLSSAHDQAAELVENAKLRARAEYDEILKEAKADAAKLIEKGRSQLELERQQMLGTVRDSAVDMVLLAAARLSQKEMDEDSDRALVSSFLSEVGAGK